MNTSPPNKTPISPTSALHALTNLRSPRYSYPPPPFPPQSIFPTKTSSSHLFHLYLPDEDDHANLPHIPDLHTLNNLQLEMKSLLALAQGRARNLSMHLQDLNAWIQSFDHPIPLTIPGAISTSLSTPTTLITSSMTLPPTPTVPPPPPPPPPLHHHLFHHHYSPTPPLQIVPSPILNHEPIPGAVLSPNDVHQLSTKNFLKRKRSQSPLLPLSQSILSSPISPPPLQSGTPPNPPRIKIKLGNGSSMSPVTSPTQPTTMQNLDWPSGSSSNSVYKRKRMDKVLMGKSSTTLNATSSSSYSRTSSGRSPRSSLLVSTSQFGWPSFTPAIPPPPPPSTTLVTHTNRLYYHQNYLDAPSSSTGVIEEEILGGDYSHPLPANKVQTVPAATFWAYLDPWLRDITEQDVRLLVVNDGGSDLRPGMHTGNESYGIPRDMLAYLDPQDLKYFIVPAKPKPIPNPTAPSEIPSQTDLPPPATTPLIPESQSVIPEPDPYSDTVTEYTPVPLATRLLASLQPQCTERRRSVNGILVKSEPGTDDHVNGTVQADLDCSVKEVSGTDTITGAIDASIKNLDTCAVVELNKSAVPVENLYQRLIAELQLPSPTGESLADDSISDQLRIAQHALRIQLSLNKARRVRTLQLSRLRLAYQEYMHLIADIDMQLEQAFSERYVPKLEKKRGKKMKKNLAEELSPDVSRSEVGAGPATTRPAFPEKIKGLLAKRKYLQATVGYVFESNPELAYRSPDGSVFSDIAGNVEVDVGSGELEVPDTGPLHRMTGEIPLSMWTCPPSLINPEANEPVDCIAMGSAETMSTAFPDSSVPLNVAQWVGESMDFK